MSSPSVSPQTSGLITNRSKSNQTSSSKSNELSPQKLSHLDDAGNQSNDHYRSRLSPFRYRLRSRCLPLIRKETEYLAKLQKSLRSPLLDFYFAWTANLASHTFYVLMLPLPIWFGASSLARDLVYVLGFGIFFSGHLKDYLCLPRPRSPPLHRITMSSYTTQEYGFPSSHSANATAVALVLLWKLFEYGDDFSYSTKIGIFIFLIIYYISLIAGRLYCGMHGFIDIITGSIVGVLCFLFRFLYGKKWDEWLLESHNDSTLGIIFTPIFIITTYLLLIHFHSEPVDDCPCFDDSVAFIGVLIGFDLSHWICCLSQYLSYKNIYHDPILINFYYDEFGLLKTVLRVVMGVIFVVIWKSISKPLIFTILPPIYKFIGIYLPRRNFTPTAFTTKTTRQIRSQSISNMGNESIGDFNQFIKGVTDRDQKDEVGIKNDIDYYEMLDYGKNKSVDPPKLNGGVFKPRYDVEIVGRLFVYAGVAATAIWGFVFGSEYCHLN